jgi:Fic family protein
MSLEDLEEQVAYGKTRLDALRPLRGEALAALERLYDIELTYASNAIEGNTLTASETQLVIEKGITIGGKSVREHMEAIDHHEALAHVRSLASGGAPFSEGDVLHLHALVMKRSAPRAAGRYADHARFVLTNAGRHAFPNPAKVPQLMATFGVWLESAPATPQTAFDAHRELVGIHPFNDGNGRTARLVMNLLLIRGGFPPVSIRPQDRLAYINALAGHQAGGPPDDFNLLLFERLRDTLLTYIAKLQQAAPDDSPAR